MFNGIIFKTGKLKTIFKSKRDILIGIENNLQLNKKDIGSSICCNGVCLTLTKVTKKLIFFNLSYETIKKSNFKNLIVGQKINLEKSLCYGQTISGNFTQGHVDTTAKIKKILLIGKSWDIKMELKDKKLHNFLLDKASISINGVSLTISEVSKKYFNLSVIPHTLKLTNLKDLKVNSIVNVELDIFGKYIYKFNK